MTRHNNLTKLFAEVNEFPSSLDFTFETNFQNKVERLVYLEKHKQIYYIILDNATCQE